MLVLPLPASEPVSLLQTHSTSLPAGQAQLTLFWQGVIPAAPAEVNPEPAASNNSQQQAASSGSRPLSGLLREGDASQMEALLDGQQQQQSATPSASSAGMPEGAADPAVSSGDQPFAEFLDWSDSGSELEGDEAGLEVGVVLVSGLHKLFLQLALPALAAFLLTVAVAGCLALAPSRVNPCAWCMAPQEELE